MLRSRLLRLVALFFQRALLFWLGCRAVFFCDSVLSLVVMMGAAGPKSIFSRLLGWRGIAFSISKAAKAFIMCVERGDVQGV